MCSLVTFPVLSTIPGWAWPYTRPIFLWPLLLVLLLSGLSVTWLVISLSRRHIERLKGISPIHTHETKLPRPGLPPVTNRRIANASKQATLLLVAIAVGWSTREWQLLRNYTHMKNLRVWADQRGETLQVIPENATTHMPKGDLFTLHFCSQSPHPIGLKRGNLVELGWYEEGQCQRVFDGGSLRVGWNVERTPSNQMAVYIPQYMIDTAKEK